MNALSILLQARAPQRECHRAYGIEVGRDLFGVWVVEMTYGRIGTAGRTKVRSFPTLDDARTQVEACLRKRATAPRRIGVAYQIIRFRQSGDRP